MLLKVTVIAFALIVLYGAICLCYFYFQKGIIHLPRKDYYETPDDFDLSFETFNLPSSDNQAVISGWFFQNSSEKPVIVFFSGNAGNMSYHLDTVDVLHEFGYSIMTYDYREFGESTGILTEQAQYEDTELIWDYLTKTRNIPPEKIILLGRSLGSAMASWLASQRQVGALIMESAFTSMYDMGRLYYKWLPTRQILRWEYDNGSRISEVRCPVLFIHSKQDELIPYRQSEQLYEKANSPKKFLTLEGGHLEGYSISRDVYFDGIRDFIERHVEQ